MIYGIKLDPSKSAEDAPPKDESVKAPDIRSMRSDSMMPLAECVSCKGTIMSWEISEVRVRLDPVRIMQLEF